jgi:phosphoenolpyruvate synthase/pyruvate phosphate dikinase
VARQLNKVCIVGCRELVIPGGACGCRLGERWFAEGDCLSLDGHSRTVYGGKVEVVVNRPREYVQEVEGWKARLRNQRVPIS